MPDLQETRGRKSRSLQESRPSVLRRGPGSTGNDIFAGEASSGSISINNRKSPTL